eukprot:GHVO01034843.1.p1 GENE.GHVO01034843.1~~GHVO01034843.1.p1  ORF type:complete len:117 (-),score=5.31 GHVO01034843.1:48-398(-)
MMEGFRWITLMMSLGAYIDTLAIASMTYELYQAHEESCEVFLEGFQNLINPKCNRSDKLFLFDKCIKLLPRCEEEAEKYYEGRKSLKILPDATVEKFRDYVSELKKTQKLLWVHRA